MIRTLITIVSIAILAGCASPRSVPEAVPADFGLSFTVLKSEGGATSAWYVIQPDGVLRAVSGVRRENTPIPPPVRTLTNEERDELWRVVRSAYWLSDSVPQGFRIAPELDAEEIAVSVSGDNRRSTLIGPLDNRYVNEMEMKLRELAWIDEGL